MSKNILDSQNLAERTLKVLAEVTKGWPLKGQYERLEEITGVKKRKWETLKNGITSPTIETLSAVAEMKPEFAAYLLMGNEFPHQLTMLRAPAVAYVKDDGTEVLLSDLLKQLKDKEKSV